MVSRVPRFKVGDQVIRHFRKLNLRSKPLVIIEEKDGEVTAELTEEAYQEDSELIKKHTPELWEALEKSREHKDQRPTWTFDAYTGEETDLNPNLEGITDSYIDHE